MKTVKLFLLAWLTSLTLSATTYFYGSSNGHDWNAATSADRMKYCEFLARSASTLSPGITAKLICDALTEFYATTDEQRLKEKINDRSTAFARSYVAPELRDPNLSWVERQKRLAELRARQRMQDPEGASARTAASPQELEKAFHSKPDYFRSSTSTK